MYKINPEAVHAWLNKRGHAAIRRGAAETARCVCGSPDLASQPSLFVLKPVGDDGELGDAMPVLAFECGACGRVTLVNGLFNRAEVGMLCDAITTPRLRPVPPA